MRVTYQDVVIEDLNKMIVEQWNKYDQLMGQLGRLENRIVEAQESSGPSGYGEPPPPHY